VKWSVGFDDEPMTQAKEVDDVPADGHLPTKLQMLKAAVAEQFPQDALVEGRSVAHAARLGKFGRGHGAEQIMNKVRRQG